MSGALKRSLLVAGGAVALLVLVALSLRWITGADRLKPRFEAVASDALGMPVRIGGRITLGFLPGIHLKAEDARILDTDGRVVASAASTNVDLELLPLLLGRVRTHAVRVLRPTLAIERRADGTFNVDGLRKAAALLGMLDGADLSISHGSLRYTGVKPGEEVRLSDFDLTVRRIRFDGNARAPLPRSLSFDARFACDSLRAGHSVLTGVKFSARGERGVFSLEPIQLSVFGGRATGSLRADLSVPTPEVQLHCALVRFRIEQFLGAYSPRPVVEGVMDFEAEITAQGATWKQLVRTAAGPLSLRGEDLALAGSDLDRNFSRFESSQNLNLIDVGSVFFAGPLGLAVSKGYNFASLFRGQGGRTTIRRFVSEWRVTAGIAQARDVALATPKNRIALQGGLDFVQGRFVDVAVAVVDEQGCARLRQVIHGPFGDPVVEKPHAFATLAGPVFRLLARARRVFPEKDCEPFYSGSVSPP